jgi:hypothetical protein
MEYSGFLGMFDPIEHMFLVRIGIPVQILLLLPVLLLLLLSKKRKQQQINKKQICERLKRLRL